MKEALIRKKALDLLRADGWHPWCPAKVRYRETDIQGVWDCLAMKAGQFPRFIQWTTAPNLSARVKKVNAFLSKTGVECWSEVWGWHAKRKCFIIKRQSAYGNLPPAEEL
jgi:predicted type IV restriction endonuclease